MKDIEPIHIISSHSSIIPPPQTSYLRRILNIGQHLLPAIWSAEAFVLFIQTAIKEGKQAQATNPISLHYTVLTGLSAGFLFSLSIKPWSLFGLRDWIAANRNGIFVILEIWMLASIPTTYLYEGTLFNVTTASFWTGYNLNELVKQAIRWWFTPSLSPVHPIQGGDHKTTDISIRSAILSTLFGATLTATSVFILEELPDDVDQLRNWGALLFAVIGIYVLFYPLGDHLSTYIPRRFHNKITIICTYLLIPFASPNLTIPHYLLLIGAGICGGLAQSIMQTNYDEKIAFLYLKKIEIQEIIKNIPPEIANFLHQLDLSEDILLSQQRQKHRCAKRIINTFSILYIIVALVYFYEHLKNSDIFAVSSITTGIINSIALYALNFLFPL